MSSGYMHTSDPNQPDHIRESSACYELGRPMIRPTIAVLLQDAAWCTV